VRSPFVKELIEGISLDFFEDEAPPSPSGKVIALRLTRNLPDKEESDAPIAATDLAIVPDALLPEALAEDDGAAVCTGVGVGRGCALGTGCDGAANTKSSPPAEEFS
jgi:hypothetical protein